MQFHTLFGNVSTEFSERKCTFFVHYWGITESFFVHPVHKHSFFEACYVFDGEGLYVEDGREYALKKGTLLLSRPRAWHQLRFGSELKLLYVAFELIEAESDEQIVEQFRRLAKTERFVIEEAGNYTTVKLMRLLWDQTMDEHPFFDEAARNLSSLVLKSFLYIFADQSNLKLPSKRNVGHLRETVIYQAKLFIKDNISQRLWIQDVANFLHISSRHLSRIFKTELGISYSDFVQNEKIRLAANLLTNSQLQIKNIAIEAGFNDVYYFTKVFTRKIGISPGRFRARGVNEDVAE